MCVYFEMDLVRYDVILVVKRDNHGISSIHYCSTVFLLSSFLKLLFLSFYFYLTCIVFI